MSKFKKHQRKQKAELRPVTRDDIQHYELDGINELIQIKDDKSVITVSISEADKENGSPKIGDMIARNPKNHNDQWLVSKEYFNENFESI